MNIPLFCDNFGVNLRNNVTHGLLDDNQCNSIESVYSWWLGLKLIFNTYWNALVLKDETPAKVRMEKVTLLEMQKYGCHPRQNRP